MPRQGVRSAPLGSDLSLTAFQQVLQVVQQLLAPGQGMAGGWKGGALAEGMGKR